MNNLAKILIVEDDATIRMILQMLLKGAGFTHVRAATRGDEGLEAIRREQPQLVLLDLMLPGLDGLTVCRRVREDSTLADVRILMLTAKSEDDDVVRGLELGADDYVTKPFSREVLLARRAHRRRAARRPPQETRRLGCTYRNHPRRRLPRQSHAFPEQSTGPSDKTMKLARR